MPSSWATLVCFLLAIAPGTVFELLSTRRRAARKESVFRETSKIVLFSLGFGAVALGLVELLRLRFPDVFFDVTSLAFRGVKLDESQGRSLVGTILLLAALATGLALGTHAVLVKRSPDEPSLRTKSAWDVVFLGGLKGTERPYAKVMLKSGVSFAGFVTDYDADLASADRELVLGAPLVKWESTGAKKSVDGVWQRIVLHHGEIDWIVVKHVQP